MHSGMTGSPVGMVEPMFDVGTSGWIVRRAESGDLRGLVALSRIDCANDRAALDARIAGLLGDSMR